MPRVNRQRLSPEGSRILVSLLSTRAAAGRKEKLSDPSSAAGWLADQGLSSPDLEVTEAEWRRLLDFREGLHALILSRGQHWTREAARRFNRTLRGAPLEVSVTADRTVRFASPDGTFDGAFGKIVGILVDNYFAGEWKRLKACANDECLRVFYDDTRTGNRKWCGVRCGDLVRTREHRRAKKYRRD